MELKIGHVINYKANTMTLATRSKKSQYFSSSKPKLFLAKSSWEEGEMHRNQVRVLKSPGDKYTEDKRHSTIITLTIRLENEKA